ncbi:MAG: hypothetical protein J6H31_07495 [Butyrivibrio sp.]|nr:hypothetical protein [Butyrivibrio sp.]
MENKELQEDTIDLGKLAQIVIEHKKEVCSIIAACTILAPGGSHVLPKQYELITSVQTRSAGKDISGLSPMSTTMKINVGSGSSSATPMNYIELILDPVIDF